MKTVSCECIGTGYVLAQKLDEPGAIPFAFRCQCSAGTMRFGRGIPTWSDRFRKAYKALGGTLHARDEVAPTKVVVAPEERPFKPTLEPLVWG